MSLAQIRSRVRTLQRRFALALSVVRARRVAERLCQGWTADHADGKPLPDPFKAVAKVREAGIRNAAFIDFQRYIRSCVDENRCPEPRGFLESLLPRASNAGLVRAALHWDARPRD